DTTRGFYCPPRTGRLPPRRSGDTEIAEYGASPFARFRWAGCLYVRVGNAVTGRCREVMPLTVTLRPPATAVHRVLDRIGHPAANHCRTGAGRQWRAGRASVVVRARPAHVGDVLDVSAPAGDFVVES